MKKKAAKKKVPHYEIWRDPVPGCVGPTVFLHVLHLGRMRITSWTVSERLARKFTSRKEAEEFLSTLVLPSIGYQMPCLVKVGSVVERL